jgi:hypothetical protein
MLRLTCPPWRDGASEPIVIGRFCRGGHAHRSGGEAFISTMRTFPTCEAELRAKCDAVRISIDRVLWPARPLSEAETLSVILPREDQSGMTDSPGEGWAVEPPAASPDGFAPGPPPDG